MRLCKNKKGFTLLEVILTMIIVGIIMGVVSQILLGGAQTYSFVSNRKATLQDVRQAMFRIGQELERIDTADINAITNTSINFTDDKGFATTIRLVSAGSDLVVFRGPNALVNHVKDFNIEYFDSLGNYLTPGLATISLVRRIKVNIKTKPVGNEGEVAMSSYIAPRAFLGYENYH